MVQVMSSIVIHVRIGCKTINQIYSLMPMVLNGVAEQLLAQ